jgi:hypothetical protein
MMTVGGGTNTGGGQSILLPMMAGCTGIAGTHGCGMQGTWKIPKFPGGMMIGCGCGMGHPGPIPMMNDPG